MLIAGLIVVGLTLYIYKPTYSVTLNGEFIGYTQDKSKLQAKINDYIQQGDATGVAFIQVDDMPEYQLCMLRKNISTNDDEIYNTVVNQGTKYYKYYALLNDGEEKYYFSNFENAENVVNKLKEKKSTNADKITVIEKYNTESEPIVSKLNESDNETDNKSAIVEKKDEQAVKVASVDTCVSSLYKKKTVVSSVRTASTSGGGSGIGASGMNTSSSIVNLGMSLIRPVSGTITSRYGPRSRDNHKGLDIGASYGSTIYATAAGTVTTSAYGYNGGYGNYVIISHGNGVTTVYGHCSSLIASQGEYVSQGQAIARVGSTGNSTGNHLHFEIRVNGITQDPQNYVY